MRRSKTTLFCHQTYHFSVCIYNLRLNKQSFKIFTLSWWKWRCYGASVAIEIARAWCSWRPRVVRALIPRPEHLMQEISLENGGVAHLKVCPLLRDSFMGKSVVWPRETSLLRSPYHNAGAGGREICFLTARVWIMCEQNNPFVSAFIKLICMKWIRIHCTTVCIQSGFLWVIISSMIRAIKAFYRAIQAQLAEMSPVQSFEVWSRTRRKVQTKDVFHRLAMLNGWCRWYASAWGCPFLKEKHWKVV